MSVDESVDGEVATDSLTAWKKSYFGRVFPSQDDYCGFTHCGACKGQRVDFPTLKFACKKCKIVRYCSFECKDDSVPMHSIFCKRNLRELQAFLGRVTNDKRFTNVLSYAQDQVTAALRMTNPEAHVAEDTSDNLRSITPMPNETDEAFAVRERHLHWKRLGTWFYELRRTRVNQSDEEILKQLVLCPGNDYAWLGLHLFATVCALSLGSARSSNSMLAVLAHMLAVPLDQRPGSRFVFLTEGNEMPEVVDGADQSLGAIYADDIRNTRVKIGAIYLFNLVPLVSAGIRATSISFVLVRVGESNIVVATLPNMMTLAQSILHDPDVVDYESAYAGMEMSTATVETHFIPDLLSLTNAYLPHLDRLEALRRVVGLKEVSTQGLTDGPEFPTYSLTTCRAFLI